MDRHESYQPRKHGGLCFLVAILPHGRAESKANMEMGRGERERSKVPETSSKSLDQITPVLS
jgi:hypothetical protein